MSVTNNYQTSGVASPGPDTIPLGDSITLRGGGVGGPLSLPYQGGDSYATMLNLLSGGRINVTRNAGVAGNTTAQMLARVQTDVIAYAPGWCIVLGGTNDLATLTTAQSMTNLTAIWDTLRDAGIRVVACTIPPKTGSTTQAAKLNVAIRFAAAKRGLPLLDFHTVLVNPTTGTYQAAYDFGDGTHPNPAGSLAMAQHAWTALSALYPGDGGPYLTDYVGDGANLLTNGLFIGDANSDGLADNWSLGGSGGSVAPTIQAGSGSDLGNWQVLTQSANGQRWLMQEFTTGYNVGDTLEFSGRIVTSGIVSGAMPVIVRLEYNSTGSWFAYAFYNLQSDLTGVFRCRGQVPAGATKVRTVVMTGVTGTGVIKVAQLTVTNLTALGVA